MTVREYISQKLSPFGVKPSEADFFDMKAYNDELTEGNVKDAITSIVNFIPSILAIPNVSENGFSITFDKEGLKEYYSFLCGQYNLPNKLSTKIKILDISDYL